VILEEIAAAYGLHGVVREREGSGSFVACPHGHFRTRDDRWIAIACTTDKMFERLAAAMGRPELAAAELYGDQRKRLAARETVDALVIDWVASLERQVILDRCLEMEVPAGKVNSPLSREAEGLGDVVVPGVVPRLSKTPRRVTHLGPTLGDATVAVLTGLLQLNAAEIAALRDKKII